MVKPNRREALGLGLGAAAGMGSGMGAEAKEPASGNAWQCLLSLDNKGRRVEGSEDDLAAAIRRGADLRIYSEFLYNEHIDPKSDNSEIVKELSEFHITYLLDNRWTAAIMTQRQPVTTPPAFGPRPSMSLFLYNQNGQQAIARPHLDGKPATGKLGPSPLGDHSDMPKYNEQDNWDVGTNAPSNNFIYDFETYRYFVRDDWREVLSHEADGTVVSGSLDELSDVLANGSEVKVALRGLCSELDENPDKAIDHEVFIEAGWSFYHTETKEFVAALHPLARVAPAIPLKYRSQNWDFGWLEVSTTGFAARLMVNPYTLKFTRSDARYALRWFVR